MGEVGQVLVEKCYTNKCFECTYLHREDSGTIDVYVGNVYFEKKKKSRLT